MGTISKAIDLLGLFSKSRPEIGLTDFVRLTHRDKATLHRHLVELEENGFLEQHPQTRLYRLGPALLRLSGVREATFPLRTALRPLVTKMAQDVGELVHVSLLQGGRLSPMLHADPEVHGTQVHFDESELLPLHATSSGLAVLAFAEPALCDAVLNAKLPHYTDKTVTNADTLRDLMAQIRQTGISQLSQAYDNEVSSQGAPIFNAMGDVAGGISIAVPTIRATPDKTHVIANTLRMGVRTLTRAIGGQIPQSYANLWRPPSD